MAKLSNLLIPRLLIVVLVPRSILAFGSGYLNYMATFYLALGPVSQGQFHTYAGVFSWIGYVLDLLLPFLLIYFLCTPDNLRETYVSIIVTIFVGSLIGGFLGTTLGYLLSAQSFGPLSSLEAIDLVLFSLPFTLIPSAYSDVFPAFTAASISYIRRRWKPIDRPLPPEETFGDLDDAYDRGVGNDKERRLLIRRLLIVALLADAVGAFLFGHFRYITTFFPSIEYGVCGSLALNVLATFLPWVPIYFLYTPDDLRNMYINIIVTLFVGALAGNLVGFSLGVMSSTQLFPPLPKVQWIEIGGLLVEHIPESIFSFHGIFSGFTAVTIAYIRRRWSASATE